MVQLCESSTSAQPPGAGRRAQHAALLLFAIVVTTLIGLLAAMWTAVSSSATSVAIASDDGHVRGDVGVGDDVAAVTHLDPALREALRRAAAEATGDGVELRINSGWRSADYQARLLSDAVARYGSRTEAARWVATPATSPHVSGDAVDISDVDAISWLSQHGAAHGLCQIYANEPWHYELRPDAASTGCPQPYADPTHDPRMRE